MVKYPLTGGLDLTTVKTLVRPGTLSECLNFEVGTIDGYTRISGLVRFDGSVLVGDHKVWRLKHAGAAVFSAGQQVHFADPAIRSFVLRITVQGATNIVYIVAPSTQDLPSLPATLNGPGGISASITSIDTVFGGNLGTQSNFNSGLATIEADQAALIGQVPGHSGSDIIGGFFFRDDLYVIRDLPRVAWSGGLFTDQDEGKSVTVDADEHLVLDVSIGENSTGTITYDPDIAVGAVHTDGIFGPIISASPAYTFDITTAPEAEFDTLMAHTTNAALYKSGTNGWERVDLGRELQFDSGTAALTNFSKAIIIDPADITDTGHVFPTVGTVDEVSNTDMFADDGVGASAGAGAQSEFKVTGFDFSALPDDALITGITVTLEKRSADPGGAKDHTIILTGFPGAIHENKATGDVWQLGPSYEVEIYGGSTDLWGSQSISPADVKDAGFGVIFIAERNDPGVAMNAQVDYIKVKIHYVEQNRSIYVLDEELTMKHVQVLGGDPALNTATGYITVSAPVNAEKTTLIAVGDEIRTAPAGGGTLLGVVSARDRPIWLPGQIEIDNNRSRYQFHHSNFYGHDRFDAVYGVSGAGPAFYFDGETFIRIRTELPANYDLPRHITRHGDMLVLGYFPGALMFTKVGDPLETRGTEGANAIEVGDRLTGLVSLAGDALGVICQSQTQVIRGITPTSMVKSPITSVRGGIEYTGVDAGRVALCDGVGIFLADTPETFGSALRLYLSYPVHPWLKPRLQATAATEAAIQRPIAALSVRHKNQTRLYFWDGWCLTMTINEPPEFTTQRYYTPAADEDSEPTPWVPRMLCTGIDSSGRERLFCSFFGAVKQGYVFEMDTGRSMDGEEVPAYLVFNPLTIDASTKDKRYDRFAMFGQGYGFATLTQTRAINDEDAFTGSREFVMGKATVQAKLKPSRMRGVFDMPAEAYDITMRFDSSTDSEGEFTLQYVEAESDDRGTSRGRQGRE